MEVLGHAILKDKDKKADKITETETNDNNGLDDIDPYHFIIYKKEKESNRKLRIAVSQFCSSPRNFARFTPEIKEDKETISVNMFKEDPFGNPAAKPCVNKIYARKYFPSCHVDVTQPKIRALWKKKPVRDVKSCVYGKPCPVAKQKKSYSRS